MSDTSSNAALIQEAFDAAIVHYEAGQLEQAEALFRAILQIDPQHPDANYNLGLLAVQFEQGAAALHFLKAALMARPDDSQFWIAYIEVLLTQGEIQAVSQTLELSKSGNVQLPDALIQRAQREIDLAAAAQRQAPPEDIKALEAAQRKDDFRTMETLGLRMTTQYPATLMGWKALSLAYFHTDRPEMALAPSYELVTRQPDNAQAHANLGLIYMTLRRLNEADTCLQHAITLDPSIADTHTNLGNVRREQGRLADAIACYRRALELNPRHTVAQANLGVVQLEQGDFRDAEQSLRAALRLDPNNAVTLNGLSTTLTKLGYLEEAEAVLQQSLKLAPDNLFAYDLVLFLLNYSHLNKAALALELAKKYGQLARRKVGPAYTQWACDPNPQRLRIGIVSGDLNNHPVGFFIEALLRHIDRERLELVAYSSMPARKTDSVSQRLHPYFSAWKSIHLLSYKQAAETIHADGIHVLLDLSGHTTDNRLPVFALKPAPVQASWLGYFATTGVAEMDYLIGDPYLCPPEEDGAFTETVWRLPETWLCFTPPQEDVAVNELPALRNGFVTYGCFNNLNKMNDAVVELWAELLKRQPDARLLLKAPQLRDAELQAQTRERFAAHGIAPGQLLLEGPSPRTEYLRAYGRIDIALDPFPYPGGTTSVEALWMGVPVLTLRGNRFLAHLGESVVHNAGLPEWVATDKDEYIAKAIGFGADRPALAQLRAGLRARMQASPLLDDKRFARNFENALWAMWQEKTSSPAKSAQPGKVRLTQVPAAEAKKLQQLVQQKSYAAAEKKGLQITQQYPNAIVGWKALSVSQYRLGKLDQALLATQKLLDMQPDETDAHSRHGLILIGLGKLQEAEASFKLALQLSPRFADAHVNLGYICVQQGRFDEAIAHYQAAIELNPKIASAHSNIGVLELKAHHLRAAESSFRAALAVDPKDRNALAGLSSALVKLGLLTEAEVFARKGIKAYPEKAEIYSTLLFMLNYNRTGSAGDALELAKRFGAMLTRTRQPRYTSWNVPATPPRLRVGLVSGDLHNHPVGYFLEGLLQHLNPAQIEIIIYSNRPAHLGDETTARLRAHSAIWRTVDELDDTAMASLIHSDGIHILLDLAGHTGDTRLPVFAYKPAPVQAAWLGYFATTGVEQMDYLIGDPNVCPPDEESHFTETIWRLPETYLCFTPPKAEIAVNALPGLTNGHITFGCFNNVGKLNDKVISVWSSILQQVPNARLLLKARQLDDAEIRTRLRARFSAHGISEDSLILEGPTSRTDYLQAYQRLDIVLDPFPYPGGTTTVEALWMGIPVLTLRGNTMLSHAGENIMKNLGLPEWIAQDPDDYVRKAKALASTPEVLSDLRSRLRTQALASPMFDAARFARHFEEALWGMWNARSSTTHTQSN